MSAAVATWNNEPMPPAVVMAPAETSSYFATPERVTVIEARALGAADRMVDGAVTLVEELAALRACNAHLVRGYSLWFEYVEHLLGDHLKAVKFLHGEVAKAERQALALSMRATTPKPMPLRAIAERLGVSLGTVAGDVREDAGDVIDISPEPEPNPYEGMTLVLETVARVAAQGDRGLTCAELKLDTSWQHQSASAALSKAKRRGLVRTDGRSRQDGYGVHVVTDLGRAKLAG